MISAAIRRFIQNRAESRCEYCLLPQIPDLIETFHIEHIVARQHRGSNQISNLAYACSRCNRHKGPNLSAIDPRTGKVVSLFNPREQSWDDHFTVLENRIIGTTPAGRATSTLLQMNAERRVELRSDLIQSGLWRE